MKRVDRSGAQRKDVEKAERALQDYQFLFWLDKFTQVRESKTNINQSDEESDRSDEDEDDERDDSMGTKSIQSGEEEDDSDGISDDDEIDNDEGITPLKCRSNFIFLMRPGISTFLQFYVFIFIFDLSKFFPNGLFCLKVKSWNFADV